MNNNKELFAVPKNQFNTRRIRVISVISLFIILIFFICYILTIINIIPVDDFFLFIFLALFEIPFISKLIYDYITSKRLIIYDNDFYKSLKNIFKMAKKRIVLGVKLGDNPEIPIAKQRPVEAYAKIFGKPILIKDAKYLTMLVF